MAKWREREHILNRFPSSVRDVFMWRTKPARARPGYCMYIPLRCSWRGLASSFWGESFEFKRFKAISQEGGASDCRLSNTDRPTTLSLFLAPPAFSPSHLIPFRLFSFLSLIPAVTYCELLREPCPKKRLSFSTRKISGNMKNGADGQQRSQYVSSRFVVTRAAGIASFVVCDNNFYDAHWLSGDRWRYYEPRRGETPPRRARIREDLS